MRCLTCGFMNSSQAFECARCKTLLDPIAAAATVNVPPDSFASRPAFNPGAPVRPPLPDMGGGPLPPLPPKAAPPAAAPVAFNFAPQRPNLGSADLDFLLESQGVSRIQKLREVPASGIASSMMECSNCHRQLPAERVFITQAGNDRLLCVECQAKFARQEEAVPRRQFLTRIVSGTVVGLVAAGVCIFLSNQYAADTVKHTLNWPLALAIGFIIGVAVRIGGLNRPNMPLQVISVLLCIGSLLGALYFGIYNLNGQNLSLNAFFDLKPDAVAYLFLGLSLIVAFVAPSGFFGGHREEVTFEQ